jgi:hypothetical protein
MPPGADHELKVSSEKKTRWRYGQEFFRAEAVEAYTTRQAGEPWEKKQRFEGLIVAALSVMAAAALALICAGGR